MFTNQTKQRVFVALCLMAFLFFGAAAAEARDRYGRNDTHGADRLVKGAAIGVAVGTVTQVVRGRTQGKELLKGAAVGGAVGAAAGAYSDYKQEKDAREYDRRRYDDRAYRNGGRGYDDRAYRNDRRGRSYRSDYYDDYAPRRGNNGRGRGRGHRHNDRCNH